MDPIERNTEEMNNSAGQATATVNKYNNGVARDIWNAGSGLVRKALDLIPDNQQVSAPVHKNPDAVSYLKEIGGDLLGAVPLIGDFFK